MNVETQTLQDPTTKYPRPPNPEQSQPWPGLVSKMTPRPDHGETTYRGSGRLTGRRGIAIPGDIRDDHFCKYLVDKAGSALGGLDILVSNAGRQQTNESSSAWA
jgi:NAD(P)-dependent dehydrogenase (short-subunit alcohol dehydrogenase family)